MNSEALQSGDSGTGELTPAQFAAMKKVDELADIIIRDYPEVADDYRSGLTQPEIALKHFLHKIAGIKVARMAVGKALKTLIPDKEEMEKLTKAIIVENRTKNGRKIHLKGLGIYSVTPEEHSERSSKAGIAARDAKTGIFALTKEERIESAKHARSCRTAEEMRQAIRKSLITQGKDPWITDLVEPISQLNEPDYLLSLIQNPEYIIQSGPRKGCNDNIKIAEKLNEVFHQGRQIRTPKAINTHRIRLRRKESQKS